MVHNPATCPYCGDLADWTQSVTHPLYVHLLAKIAELESRLQSIEWRGQPLGPGVDDYGRINPADHTNDLLKNLKPECAKCYDEEGSYGCVRPAHGNMRHGKTENA